MWFASGAPRPAVPAGYPFVGEYSGTPVAHPQYASFAAFPATFDIGVVLLDTPHPGPYASLAPLGTVDALRKGPARHDAFDLVGYGLQDKLPPVFQADIQRYFGTASLVNTHNQLTDGYSVQLTAAPGTGGSLCFGDSGGPVFLAGTTSIVAVSGMTNPSNTKSIVSESRPRLVRASRPSGAGDRSRIRGSRPGPLPVPRFTA